MKKRVDNLSQVEVFGASRSELVLMYASCVCVCLCYHGGTGAVYVRTRASVCLRGLRRWTRTLIPGLSGR